MERKTIGTQIIEQHYEPIKSPTPVLATTLQCIAEKNCQISTHHQQHILDITSGTDLAK